MPVKFINRAELQQVVDKIAFPKGFKLSDHLRPAGKDASGQQVFEFIGTDSFGDEWNQRMRFEIDAGRDEEPLVYQPLYEVINDSSLPKNVPVQRMGPGGVFLEEIYEGGEVKFGSIESSEFTVPIKHYGVGLEYSKDLVVFNEMWRVPIYERAVGIAYNALLNHLHLNPILAYSYSSANQTAAVTTGDNDVEDVLLTLEAAVVNAVTDTSNPRRGPYTLLIHPAKQFLIEKALERVPQQRTALRSSAIDMIRNVISYDGWTGERGGKTVTYSGVTSTKGYLVSQQYRGQDFVSFMKQDLGQDGEERDISRFMYQVVWDTYFGVYANPLRAVEEITWP